MDETDKTASGGPESIRSNDRPSANPQSREHLDEGTKRDEAEAELEEGLEESFPASDPPAVTNPSHPGVPIGEI